MGLVDQWLGITAGRQAADEKQIELETKKKALTDLLNPPTLGQELHAPTSTPEQDAAFTQAMKDYQIRKAALPTASQVQDNASLGIPAAPAPVEPVNPIAQKREEFAKNIGLRNADQLSIPEKQIPNIEKLQQGNYWAGRNETSTTNQLLKNQATTQKQSSLTLDPASVDFYASSLLTTGQLPNMGMGSGAARLQIMNRAAAMAKEQGLGDQALALNKATYAAGQAELTNLQKNRGMIDAFEATANKNITLVRNLAGALDNTGVPALNKWINAGKKAVVGDPAVTNIDLAIRGLVGEYAKVVTTVTGSGTTAEAARSKIEADLNNAQSPEQIYGVLDTMAQEMNNRKTSYDDQLDQIKSQMIGAGQTGATPKVVVQPGKLSDDLAAAEAAIAKGADRAKVRARLVQAYPAQTKAISARIK